MPFFSFENVTADVRIMDIVQTGCKINCNHSENYTNTFYDLMFQYNDLFYRVIGVPEENTIVERRQILEPYWMIDEITISSTKHLRKDDIVKVKFGKNVCLSEFENRGEVYEETFGDTYPMIIYFQLLDQTNVKNEM